MRSYFRWTAITVLQLTLITLIFTQTVVSVLVAIRVDEVTAYIVITLFTTVLVTTTAIGVVRCSQCMLYINTIASTAYCLYLIDCKDSALKCVLLLTSALNTLVSLMLALLLTAKECLRRRAYRNCRLREEVATLALPVKTISGNYSLPTVVRNGYEKYVITRNDRNDNFCVIINSESLNTINE